MEDCKFLLLGLLVVLSTLIHLCYGQQGHIHHGGLSREYLLALNTRAHQYSNLILINEYRDACLMAFTETWFDSSVSDHVTFIEGFGCPTRLDRDKEAIGKERGRGVWLHLNERLCKNVIVRDRLCTPDIELLNVSLRPLYLPREFPQLFVTVVYIHPRANVDRAAHHSCDVTQSLDALSADAHKYWVISISAALSKVCLSTTSTSRAQPA